MYLLDLFGAKLAFIAMIIALVVIPVIALYWAFAKRKSDDITPSE